MADERIKIPDLEPIDGPDITNGLLFPVDTGVQSFNMTLAQLTAFIQTQIQGVPSGTVTNFAGAANKVPFGWFLCDGQLLLRADYPALFNAISTNHGSTTIHNFRVPDLRGMFVRGVDMGTGRDPDRAARGVFHPGSSTGDNVGSYQPHMLAWHVHQQSRTAQFVVGGGGYGSGTRGPLEYPNTGGSGGNETRPINIYMHYIIKI